LQRGKLLSVYQCSCHNIDSLIGGAFETGIITQIYGEPAGGKTSLCLQLAVNVLRTGKRAIFINTQKFPSERFTQIAGEDARVLARKILVFEVTSFEHQTDALREIKKIVSEDIGLIVFDSATTFYRLEQAKSYEIFLRRKLVNQMLFLLGLAKKYNLVVLITNQIYENAEAKQVLPVGGHILEQLSAVMVQFTKIGSDLRRAILKKHRSLPEGAVTEFRIVPQGLVDA
jgi:DNA repair protein RadB